MTERSETRPYGGIGDTVRMFGRELYIRTRWILAAVQHPVETFKAVTLVGGQEQIDRSVEEALRLPIGRQRLQS